MRCRLATSALAITAALAFAAPAAAHDPIAEYLYANRVYASDSAQEERAKLDAVVAEAGRAGFALRVAVVSAGHDLDEYASTYWRRPRAYAAFLGAELRRDGFRGAVVVVMRNGVAFDPPQRWQVPVAGDELAAATAAVERLAHVTAPAKVTTQAQRNSHDRLVIILVTLAALAAAIVVRYALRRRR